MSFFHFNKKAAKALKANTIKGFSVEMMHQQECKICPLNDAKVCSPKMEPLGVDAPLVYMLGDNPTRLDDERDKPFSGETGAILRQRIPQRYRNRLRWNHIVRTHNATDGDLSPIMMEACRPSVIADIEACKPDAIFGFGPAPLKWAIKQDRITNWRGRRIPIQVGNHVCWLFPMLHPDFIRKTRKFVPQSLDRYGSDLEFAFALDLERAFDFLDGDEYYEPQIDTRADALANIELVTDPDQAIARIKQMWDEKSVGLDYETSALRPFNPTAKILTTALSGKDLTFAWPTGHHECTWSDKDKERVNATFRDFLLEAPCTKASHHLGFELEWSAFTFGRDVVYAGQWEDTEGQAYILDYRPGAMNLSDLCFSLFGLDIKAITGNLDSTKIDDLPLDLALKYNGLDAKYHRKAFVEQWQQLKTEELLGTYDEQVRRTQAAVLVQIKGVPIDVEQTKKLDTELTAQIKEIEERLHADPDVIEFKKRKGYPFRPEAWQDVKFLHNKIMREVIDKTDEEELTRIGLAPSMAIVEWRKATKLRSTYVLPMLPGSPILFPGNLIHPILGTTSTRTWRTSSDSPNAQNFPKHALRAKTIRKQIAALEKAGKRYVVVSFDYAAIQARNVAMESLDKNLIRVFTDNHDIHSDWRDRLLKHYPRWEDAAVGAVGGVNADDKGKKAYRQKAKNEFVFASFFGAQPPTLSEATGIPEQHCERALQEFYREFPDLPRWHKRLKRDYYRYGYVTGLSGFRRYAPVSPNEIINTPIQSDESVIVLGAMSQLCETGQEVLIPNLEVHDDLTFVWEHDRVDEYAEQVIDVMINPPYDWAKVVPIGVEMSIGRNWGEMVEVWAGRSNTWTGKIERKYLDWEQAA